MDDCFPNNYVRTIISQINFPFMFYKKHKKMANTIKEAWYCLQSLYMFKSWSITPIPIRNNPTKDLALNTFPVSLQMYFPAKNVMRNFIPLVTGMIVDTPTFVEASVQMNVILQKNKTLVAHVWVTIYMDQFNNLTSYYIDYVTFQVDLVRNWKHISTFWKGTLLQISNAFCHWYFYLYLVRRSHPPHNASLTDP